MAPRTIPPRESGERASSSSRPPAEIWVRITLALVVASLVGVVALPDGSRSAEARRARRDGMTALHVLGGFREALDAYWYDHGSWPGWDSGRPDGSRACPEWLESQLTRFTDASGATVATADPEHPFGPYLGGGIPANPLNGLTSVRVVAEGEEMPLAADGRTGWIYDPRTGLLRINSPGRIEGSGAPTFDW